MSDLYEKTNYLSPCSFIISSIITEYDISKANISILKKYNVINDKIYNDLYNSDRMTRQIYIGKMIRDDQEVGKTLKNGIMEARRAFFEYNHVEDYEVLSIKNDAIYLVGREAQVLDCDGIHFSNKNVYTSYYKLKNKECYYFLNRMNGNEVLDIKGMSDDKVGIHDDYFVDFLKEIFFSAQCDDIRDTLSLLTDFYMTYVNLEFPIEYYRRFDGDSRYDIKQMSSYANYKSDYLPESQKAYVDISYNLEILIELQKIFSSIYFQRNNRM